jgi:hypothetical protein
MASDWGFEELGQIVASLIPSTERARQAQMNQYMQLLAKHKPWTMKPGMEQQTFYETFGKYRPSLGRRLFRGEREEYFVPPAGIGGALNPFKGKYIAPEKGVYFEEPARQPLWTEKEFSEVQNMANKLYGPGKSEDKTEYIRKQFGADKERKFAAETAANLEAEAEQEAERILGENPDIRNIPSPIGRMNAILEKMNPKKRAPFRKAALPRVEAEARIGETERYHKETESARLRNEKIAKDREARLAEDMKFRQGLSKEREKRLGEDKINAAKATDVKTALKAADEAYARYLVEYRWELEQNNKLQENFLNRARVVGDTEFVPKYRNPTIEQPMSPQEWLESAEGYPYAKRVRELGGAKGEGVAETELPPLTVEKKKKTMNEIRRGMGIPTQK